MVLIGIFQISSVNATFALGNALDNEYASHLLSGKSLPINFNTWNHTDQPNGKDKNSSTHISRSVPRLKSIFITLHKLDGVAFKQANDFYNPAHINAQMDLVDEHQDQVQIGSKRTRWQKAKCNLGKLLVELLRCILHGIVVVSRSLALIWKSKSGQSVSAFRLNPASHYAILNFKDCDTDGVADTVPSRKFCALKYDCLNYRSWRCHVRFWIKYKPNLI